MEPDMVAGQWKNFEFKLIEESEYSEALLHLRESFYVDEPLSLAVKGGDPKVPEDRANDLDNRITYFMKDNLSIIARDVKTGKVAGVLIIRDHSKEKEIPDMIMTSPISKTVRAIMVKLELSVDLFTKFGVDHYADIFIVSVSKESRSTGLATELYRRGISMLSHMGYPLIESIFSNPHSRRIGQKLGFQELSRVVVSEAKDKNGEKFVPNAPPDLFVNFTVLKLSV